MHTYLMLLATVLETSVVNKISTAVFSGDEAQLPSVDYAKAFANYLLTHGMSQQQLDALIQALTGK